MDVSALPKLQVSVGECIPINNNGSSGEEMGKEVQLGGPQENDPCDGSDSVVENREEATLGTMDFWFCIAVSPEQGVGDDVT